MNEVGWPLWRLSSSPPLFRAGSPTVGCSGLCLVYLQGQKLSGQPVTMLSHPQGKEVSPDVQRGPSVFHFVSIASCSVWVPLTIAWLHLICILPSHIFYTKVRPSWTYSSPGWTVPHLPDCFLINDSSVSRTFLWLMAGLAPINPYFSCTGQCSTGTITPEMTSLRLSRGRTICVNLLAVRSSWCMKLLLPRYRTWHFPFLNFSDSCQFIFLHLLGTKLAITEGYQDS